MRSRLPDRVVGIYPADRLFRLIYVQDGKRQSLWLHDEAEALRERRRLEKKFENAHSRTIAEFLEEYLSESVKRGNMTLESSLDCGVRVRLFLKDYLHSEPKSVTAKRAQEIYDAAVTEPSKKTGKPLAAASHRYYLAATNRLFKWMIKSKYIALNPFEGVKPIGRKNAGKHQLRIEEARRFVSAALDLFQQNHDRLALGALLALSCGLRSSEVRLRRVRDVDDGGRVLWIDQGKSHNAKRNPIIPEFLRPYVLQACEGKPADAFLFGENAKRPGEPRHRQKVNEAVARICKRAGVQVVCPHSLRGLWATLAVEAGTATEAVAAALGHGSFAMTARHYAQPGAIQSAKTARVMSALGLDESPAAAPALPAGQARSGTLAELEAQLAQLDPKTLRRLMQSTSRRQSFLNRSGTKKRGARPSRNSKVTCSGFKSR